MQESPVSEDGGAVTIVVKKTRKRKQAIPEDQKDEKYRAKRLKNNLAAQRSRFKRNGKEIKILKSAVGLTKENKELKRKLSEAEIEIAELKQRLSYYENQERK